MKRPLFVFAGQSNMMGAAVYEASEQIIYKNSFEYLHKPKRFGEEIGCFKKYGFPCGEFSYIDFKKAYCEITDSTILSNLSNYKDNVYFGPSMSNLKNESEKTTFPFESFSESTRRLAPSLAPYMISLLEDVGLYSAYTHIAKGAVSIEYFINGDAASYFNEKVTDFFEDCNKKFNNTNLGERILVWLQGESDSALGYNNYFKQLEKLWDKCKILGFTKFFIIRVGYWGDERIIDIMKAQEDFCTFNDNVYLLTRVCSFMEFYFQDKQIYNSDIPDEFLYCRDSFYGFNNQHINEKGFKTIAKYAVPNILRILLKNQEPILEEELIKFC